VRGVRRQSGHYGESVRTRWVTRDIEAPARIVWDLLVDPDAWPDWGPSIRRADLRADRLHVGAQGSMQTVLGITVPFEITTYRDQEQWAWRVAAIRATDHSLVELGQGRCRAGIGIAWPAAPYLLLCRVALARLERLSLSKQVVA
jgi:hypothetical protein